MAKGPPKNAMRPLIHLRMGAWVSSFAPWPAIAGAGPRPSKLEETVVFSDGLKGRITDSGLRRAKLVFDDSFLSVEV